MVRCARYSGGGVLCACGGGIARERDCHRAGLAGFLCRRLRQRRHHRTPSRYAGRFFVRRYRWRVRVWRRACRVRQSFRRALGGRRRDRCGAGDGSSRFDISDGPDYFNSSVSGEWGASLKGRIGYLVSPDTLFYAFGGGGIETWLNRNLSVRAQYEYAMFGNLAASEGITVDSHVGTATLGAVLHFGK